MVIASRVERTRTAFRALITRPACSARALLQVPDQINNPDAQCVGNDFQCLNRDVAFPAFDLSDMGAMQS